MTGRDDKSWRVRQCPHDDWPYGEREAWKGGYYAAMQDAKEHGLPSSTRENAHVHRCMSCGQRWYCPHPPSDCKAGENAFPSLTLRGPDGPTVFHHACPVKK